MPVGGGALVGALDDIGGDARSPRTASRSSGRARACMKRDRPTSAWAGEGDSALR